MILKIFLQNNRIVVFCPIEQRYFPFQALVSEQRKSVLILAQLGLIPFFELRPFAWVVSKPFSKLSRRGDIFEPQVHYRFLLG